MLTAHFAGPTSDNHVARFRNAFDNVQLMLRGKKPFLVYGISSGALRAAIEATLEKALEDELVLDATLAASAQQAQGLWRLRESMTEAQKPEGGSIKHDVSTPVSSMAKFIAEACAAVERAFPPKGEMIEVAGATLHVVDLGPRDAALPIVMLHGASSNLEVRRRPRGDGGGNGESRA